MIIGPRDMHCPVSVLRIVIQFFVPVIVMIDGPKNNSRQDDIKASRQRGTLRIFQESANNFIRALDTGVKKRDVPVYFLAKATMPREVDRYVTSFLSGFKIAGSSF